MHVFIDTNILLNFYHFSKDDLSALSNVFTTHEHGAAQIHLTSQVRDEFLRNRESKIADALKRFKGSIPAPQIPSFMRSYDEYEKIKKLATKLKKKCSELQTRANEDISSRSLQADKLIADILGEAAINKVTNDVFAEAEQRMGLGNPPGKNGSLGDAVNWILLLNKVPEGKDLHLISEDGDFFSVLDDSVIHPFLAEEWAGRKNSKVFAYRTISKFLKERFDGVAFSYDSKKEELIDALSETGSFAGTHALIAKLEDYSYFSLSEIERILSAAEENGQFGMILEDYDVSDFLNRVVVPHRGSVKSDYHKKALDRVIKEKQEREE
jgi:predicted nucleic acid-binding protein